MCHSVGPIFNLNVNLALWLILDHIFFKDSNTVAQLGTWKDLVSFLVIRMKIPRVKKNKVFNSINCQKVL